MWSRSRIIRRVQREHLTYLDASALTDLERLARDRGVEGVIVEAGCALGGSALVMTAAKRREQPLLVFDVFDMIPPPSPRDGSDVHERYAVIASGTSPGIAGDRYYGYEPDLLSKVRSNFDRFGLAPEAHHVSFIRGLYEDTLHIDRPVSLGHVDCDWYDSVVTCLVRLWPHVSPGGRLVIDDYDHWSGCRRAVDDFLHDHDDYTVERRARLHIVKQ